MYIFQTFQFFTYIFHDYFSKHTHCSCTFPKYPHCRHVCTFYKLPSKPKFYLFTNANTRVGTFFYFLILDCKTQHRVIYQNKNLIRVIAKQSFSFLKRI